MSIGNIAGNTAAAPERSAARGIALKLASVTIFVAMSALIKADSATGAQSCAFEIDFTPHVLLEPATHFVLAPLILIIVCCWCDGRWTRLPQVQLHGQVQHQEVRQWALWTAA